MKIAFFTSHPARVGSGSERLMYDTAKGLIARGHGVRVYTMNSGLPGTGPLFERQIPTLPGERVIERIFRRVTGYNDLLFPSTLLLRILPWTSGADVWHFHNLHGHFVSIPCLALLSWTKKIVISPVDQYLITGHCPYPMDCDRYSHGCGSCPRPDEGWPGISRDSTRALWLIKRACLRFAKFHYLFHTNALADIHQREVPYIKQAPVIHYGVDLLCYRPFPKAESVKMLGTDPGTSFVVGLFHSHITEPRKGLIPLISKIGAIASDNRTNIALLVVGNGSEQAKSLVPEAVKVFALPFIKDPHELAAALNLCDVLLYPTRAENLSLTCLFALACGVPVISYDVGGQGEAIVDNENGFLVPLGDHDQIIYNLLKVVDNPSLKARLASAARLRMEKEFDIEMYIGKLSEYYKTLS